MNTPLENKWKLVVMTVFTVLGRYLARETEENYENCKGNHSSCQNSKLLPPEYKSAMVLVDNAHVWIIHTI
jgi:hypothetical protein